MTRESHEVTDEYSTRQRILDAAMKLFAERGYVETPIKAIARACNMSDAGVFHHFPTKRDILSAVLERPHRRMPSYVHDEPVRDIRTLEKLVFRTLDSASENEPILRLLIRQQLINDPEAIAARNMALANWQIALKGTWFSGFHPDDCELLVEQFVNAMMGWMFLMQVRHGPALVGMLKNEALRAHASRVVCRAVPIERFRLYSDQTLEQASS